MRSTCAVVDLVLIVVGVLLCGGACWAVETWCAREHQRAVMERRRRTLDRIEKRKAVREWKTTDRSPE